MASRMSFPDPKTIEGGTMFTWTLKNFDMCTHQTSKRVASPEFSHFGRNMTKFYVMLYPRGMDADSADYLSVFIGKRSCNETQCKTVYTCKSGIVTESGKQCVFRFNEPLIQGHGIGLPKFLDRKNLSTTADFTMFCFISDESSADHPQTTSPDAELLELSESFRKVYEEGLLTDMKLQTKGKTTRVHRAMIEARFPKRLAKIKVDGLVNIEWKTADALLHYIYTGTFKKSDLHLLDLSQSPDLLYYMKSLLGVRCRDIKAETVLSRKCVSFKWEVKQFRSLTSDDVLWYSMPDSDIHSWTWLKFSLTVSSNEPSDSEDILFSVTRHSKECKRIVCRISALDMCKTFDHTFGKEDCWNIPAFARRCEVVGEGSEDASFLFEVSLTDGKSTSCVNSIELPAYSSSSSDTVDDLESFRDDLETMLKSRIHHDVDLITFSKTPNEHRFPCHQFVLAARSQVFRKMFETKETLHKVPITDVEPEIVESMLQYLYTGSIDDFSKLKQTLDLYELGYRYEIPGIKKECMQRIKSSLSVDNLGEVLVAADKWKDADLKEDVFDFVCKFPRPVLESSWFKEVLGPRSDLALEILSKVLTCLAGKNSVSKEVEETK